MLNDENIGELESLFRTAKERTEIFNDSVNAQAELHGLDPVALRQFIVSRVRDKIGSYRKRADDCQLLLSLDLEDDPQ